MTTYTLDSHATIRELEAAGMDSRQAEAVVAALSRSDVELATKADHIEITDLKSEFFRALWIQGAGLVGIQLAIAGLLFAAIRFLD
ncbi:MAG: hypothetical protein F4X19_02155 [Acidobacteria bacterium]|nr:hypothetical protein [Acidobacteriota bacterium]MYC80881.1 hypothetical protein [Acidobacteriota bacterium]